MSKIPDFCPDCDNESMRDGECGRCGFVLPEPPEATQTPLKRRWDHPGWPDERQRQIGRKRIQEIRRKYLIGKGDGE